MKLLKILLPLVCMLTAGCASVNYTKINTTKEENYKGIRYYNSSPYLLVYPNGKGGLVTQVLFIADPQKKMSVKVKSFLSSAQTTMEFDKGVYQNSKSTVDASVVPTEIVKAVQAAGTKLLSAANAPMGGTNERSMPAPHLYRILINGTTVSFVGSQGDAIIHVNLLEPEKTPRPAPTAGREDKNDGKTEKPDKKDEKTKSIKKTKSN